MSEIDTQPTDAAVRRRTRKPEPGQAVRMTGGRGREMFPADDPRAGAFEPGRVYRVPEDIDQAVAEALVAGGGYEWCERPAEGEQ